MYTTYLLLILAGGKSKQQFHRKDNLIEQGAHVNTPEQIPAFLDPFYPPDKRNDINVQNGKII